MLSIEGVLDDVRRAVEEARDDLASGAGVLRDPLALLGRLLAGEERRLASERRLGVPVPRFCIFSITWRCNLRCRGCYAAGYSRGGEMAPDAALRVLGEACGLGSFLFVIVGGEPLLVPGIIRRLAGLPDGLFFLFTNGTLLADQEAEEIAAAGNILPVISVEGDLTDARRGPGVAARAARAMEALRSRGVPFGFSALLTHANAAAVTSRRWFDRAWKDGARFAFLLDYVPVESSLDPDLVLSAEDRELAERNAALRHAEGRPIVLHFPPDEYHGGCQAAGRGFIHINADGFVEPCPFSHFACDNVLRKPLEEILASPYLADLRHLVASKENPRKECLLHVHRREVAEIARRHGGLSTERPLEQRRAS